MRSKVKDIITSSSSIVLVLQNRNRTRNFDSRAHKIVLHSLILFSMNNCSSTVTVSNMLFQTPTQVNQESKAWETAMQAMMSWNDYISQYNSCRRRLEELTYSDKTYITIAHLLHNTLYQYNTAFSTKTLHGTQSPGVTSYPGLPPRLYLNFSPRLRDKDWEGGLGTRLPWSTTMPL